MEEVKKTEEDTKEKEYHYFTESSSYFDSTEEEDLEIDEETYKKMVKEKEEKAFDEWEDEGDKKKDEVDTWFIYKESEKLYQKRKDELVNVTRKAKAIKVDKHNFFDLKTKKNCCEVPTPDGEYKLKVRAIGLEESVS